VCSLKEHLVQGDGSGYHGHMRHWMQGGPSSRRFRTDHRCFPRTQPECSDSRQAFHSARGRCGMCGRTCPAINGTPSCVNGACQITCDPGYRNCNGSSVDGCEVSVQNDPSNCGNCGTVCSSNHIPTPTCSGGVCNGACAPGFQDCDANKQANGCEVSTSNDVNNCGGCGLVCSLPNATAACTSRRSRATREVGRG